MLSRRSAMIAVLSLPLGSISTVKAQGAALTIDLDQWKRIEVYRGKEAVVLDVDDIFQALQRG